MRRRSIFEGGAVRSYLRSRQRRGRWFHHYRRDGREISLGVHGLPPDDPRVLAAYLAEHMRWSQYRQADERPASGTFAAVLDAYLASPEWARLANGTQKARLAILKRHRAAYGTDLASAITAEALEAELADRPPHAAVNEIKALRGVFAWAKAKKLIARDPANAAQIERAPTKGFPTMDADEIARFQDRWPVGTRERLVFDLAILTGAARADLCRLSARNVKGGVLTYARQKTGVEAHIPMTAELRAVIARAPSIPAFILTSRGKPYTPESLGNLFGDACRAAKVDSARLHSLRKAFCVYWAEKGRSTHEIAAMAGHLTLGEVGRYTRAADRKAMIARLAEGA